MQVRFLGSAGAWSVPRPGCACPQCLSRDSRDRRSRSAVLVDDSLLIDCGPDFSGQWRRASFPRIRHVVLTHGHHDHLMGLRELCPEYGDLPWGRLTVWAMEETLEQVVKVHGKLPLDLQPLALSRPAQVGRHEVELLPVVHSPSTPAAGVFLSGIFYAPDVKDLPRETFHRVSGTEVVIMDGSLPEESLPNHHSMEEASDLAFRLGAERLYLTHLGHSGRTHRDLEALVGHRPSHHVAWDGLTVSVGM